MPEHSDAAPGPDAHDTALSVACLCAAWCHTCDDYRPVFDEVAAEWSAPGAGRAPRWIDIEDEEELIGDVDVETFPTLLVYDERHVLFAGPLTPQPETLRRLLRGLSGSGPARVDAAWEALAARLRVER